MSSIIEMRNISKSYRLAGREQNVLDNISFTVKAGECVSIMGASGSGKSTLMNLLGLLDRPSSGEYVLDGKEVFHLSENQRAEIRNEMIGFVFQQFFLLPRLNALQNVALPFLYAKHKHRPKDQKALCMSMLERVGMANWAKHKPMELSGGQQQRVAIARALLVEPSVILADEPTGALDSTIGQEVIDLFLQLNRDDKVTILIVTHDAKVAAQCQRILHVKDGKFLD